MNDNDTLAALILPWAKDNHPEKYEQTIAQSQRATTYRKFLLRLIEIRAQEDKSWRNTVPFVILEETAVSATVRLKSGQQVIVAGAGVPDRHFSFKMLQMCMQAEDGKQTLQSMLAAGDEFSLEIM